MTEEWKTIPEYPNYSVSNLGRVRNDLTGQFLKPAKCVSTKGCSGKYYQVLLYRGSKATRKLFMIHRLVANAFISNPDDLPEVNHLDGNGFNNSVENLEWVSYSENLTHAYRVLNRNFGFAGGPKRVVRVEDGHIFNSLHEAAQSCGLKSLNGLQSCLKGTRHTAGGYHWKYLEDNV